MQSTSQTLTNTVTAPFKEYVQSVRTQVQEKQLLYEKYNEKYRTVLKQNTFNNKDNLSYDDILLPQLDVVNIVISSKMNLNTSKIKDDRNCEYYPHKFPGYIYRVYHPCKSTLLVFSTGNVICTGTRFTNDASRILGNFHNKFRTDPQDNEIPKLNVKNLVVQVYFKYIIDVDETINTLPRAIYEPEQFPGIIYRNINPKAVVLLFVSGKSICVGCDNLENAFDTVFQLRKTLLDKDLLVLKR
jgi:transcription initiation factor TFIID TATA-box-binding protein